MPAKIRIGVTGSGFMGRTHVDAARRLESTEIVAVSGGSRAPQLAADYGIDCEPDTPSLVARPDIDAIVITVLHEGLPRASSVLEPDTSVFRMNGTEPGNYEVRVVCLREELRGPASSCILEAEAFQEAFTRGNCNSDGAFDLTDAIFTLNTLFFAGVGEFLCEEACDSNDDGELNITDAIFTLSALFLGTALPPEPYPSCGYDPKPAGAGSSLACEQGFCPVQ